MDGKRLKNKNDDPSAGYPGGQLAPHPSLFWQEGNKNTNSRPPSPSSVLVTSTLCLAPSALPPTCGLHPSPDQILPLSFCLAAPFQGLEASVSGNTEGSGEPKGQL